MKRYRAALIFFFFFVTLILCGRDGLAQMAGKEAFYVVPLGVKGGLDESNLSAYLVAAKGTQDYVCLDAGTLRVGLQKAVDSGVFGAGATTTFVMKHLIRAYLISHPHLDHVAGLIINSPDDSSKNIYALPFCIDVLRDNYFTWKSWANFGDQGDKPALGKYHYDALVPGRETPVEGTHLTVTAFPLSHSKPNESTAFLVSSGEACLLYLGDTGADAVEGSDRLHLLWTAIAPLIRTGRLKAIFIEVSFPDEQPEKSLFGHLTPGLLAREMKELETLAGDASLKGFPVVITHMKPSGNQEAMIKKELMDNNPLQLRWIFPEQAKRLIF